MPCGTTTSRMSKVTLPPITTLSPVSLELCCPGVCTYYFCQWEFIPAQSITLYQFPRLLPSSFYSSFIQAVKRVLAASPAYNSTAFGEYQHRYHASASVFRTCSVSAVFPHSRSRLWVYPHRLDSLPRSAFLHCNQGYWQSASF